MLFLATLREGGANSGIISIAETFNWSGDSKKATLSFSYEAITTHNSINTNSYFILNKF